MTPNSPRCSSDAPRVSHVEAVDGALSSLCDAPSEAQNQGIKLQRVIGRFVAIRGVRPAALVGAILAPATLYVLQGWSIALPGVPAWAIVLLVVALTGSIVVDGAVTLARLVCNAPWLLHYWNLFEVWSKYRLGRIPPERYYAHGAVLDYQRLYGHIPPDARPETQAEFVRHVVRWKLASKRIRKRVGRKRSFINSRAPVDTRGTPS